MKKYKLIVDSSCDIPEVFVKGKDFSVTNLLVNFGERTYIDRKEITTAEIIKKFNEINKNKEKNEYIYPKTSALNISDLIKVFEEELKKYEHIFYLPISSEISSIFNNARLAKQSVDEKRITVLDSMQLSSGIGLEAIGILNDMEKNLSPEEIEKNHYERAKRVQMQFVFDNMEFLYKGGRCSGMTYFFGNKLHLHPIIKLENKKMVVSKVVRGKDIEKGVKEMCRQFIDEFNNYNIDLDYPLLVPNVMSPSGIKKLKHELVDFVGDKIIFPVDASGIICCHCGEDTLGFAYMTKEPLKR